MIVMINISKIHLCLLASIFFLVATNSSLVFADHESNIQDPNNDIQFFIKNVLPACEFYDQVGLKPITADCSEWYQTHDGNMLVIKYIMK
jgi:hypothetical protein